MPIFSTCAWKHSSFIVHRYTPFTVCVSWCVLPRKATADARKSKQFMWNVIHANSTEWEHTEHIVNWNEKERHEVETKNSFDFADLRWRRHRRRHGHGQHCVLYYLWNCATERSLFLHHVLTKHDLNVCSCRSVLDDWKKKTKQRARCAVVSFRNCVRISNGMCLRSEKKSGKIIIFARKGLSSSPLQRQIKHFYSIGSSAIAASNMKLAYCADSWINKPRVGCLERKHFTIHLSYHFSFDLQLCNAKCWMKFTCWMPRGKYFIFFACGRRVLFMETRATFDIHLLALHFEQVRFANARVHVRIMQIKIWNCGGETSSSWKVRIWN